MVSMRHMLGSRNHIRRCRGHYCASRRSADRCSIAPGGAAPHLLHTAPRPGRLLPALHGFPALPTTLTLGRRPSPTSAAAAPARCQHAHAAQRSGCSARGARRRAPQDAIELTLTLGTALGNAGRRGVHCGGHLLVAVEHADLAVGVHVDDHAIALLRARARRPSAGGPLLSTACGAAATRATSAAPAIPGCELGGRLKLRQTQQRSHSGPFCEEARSASHPSAALWWLLQ